MALRLWWCVASLAALGGCEPEKPGPVSDPSKSGALPPTSSLIPSGSAGVLGGAGSSAGGLSAGRGGSTGGRAAAAGSSGAGGSVAGSSAAVGGSGTAETGGIQAAGSGGAATGAAGAIGASASGGAAPAPVTGGGACGPGLKSGRSDETVMVADVARTFVYYAPAGLDPNVPVPLVIAAHGFSMTGDMMFNITGYTQLADREKFVVLFPDGDPNSVGPWSVGDGICGLGTFVTGLGSDQEFVDEMLRFVESDRCIDRDHLFMTGFSMGGYFSNETACLRPEFRAVAPHSGGSHDLSSCVTERKPVILHHFVDDTLIDYQCSVEARDRWVERNGCSPSDPEVVTVKGGSCEYYTGCPDDGQVAFCSYNLPAEGGGELVPGHAWSGGAQDVPSGGSFAIPATESATELTWAFWKEYAW